MALNREIISPFSLSRLTTLMILSRLVLSSVTPKDAVSGTMGLSGMGPWSRLERKNVSQNSSVLVLAWGRRKV